MTDHRTPERQTGRDAQDVVVLPLPTTADKSCGSSNLATRPRAGNLSTDTRAGRPW